MQTQQQQSILPRTHIYNQKPPIPVSGPQALREIIIIQQYLQEFIQILHKGGKFAHNSQIRTFLDKQLPIFEGLQLGIQKCLCQSIPKYENLNKNQQDLNEICNNNTIDFEYDLQQTQVNVTYLEQFCGYLSDHFLQKYVQIFKNSKCVLNNSNYNQNSKNSYDQKRDAKILLSSLQKPLLELKCMSQILKLANKFEIQAKLKVNEHDIIAKSERHWAQLDKKIDYKLIFKDTNVLEKQMYSFLHMISITNSVCYKTNEMEEGLSKSLYEVMYTIYFKLFRKQSFLATNQFLAEEDMETSVKVAVRTWNGLDKVLTMRYWVQATWPGVNYHQKLYLHRTFEPITLEKVLNWNKKGNHLEKEKLNKLQIDQNNTDTNILQKTNKIDKVKVRIISNVPLVEKKQRELNSFEKFLQKIPLLGQKQITFGNNAKDIEKVIIHIHGGGWVSMSSFSHQMYTRRWANHPEFKDIPIISVDYRKAPTYAYPCALEDCWQVYLFVLYELKNYYNINPKKIIMTGDSAGGNMVLGICQLCEKYDIQKPDGVLLSYPAVNLADNSYTPSINKSMTDLICPFPFLELCMNLYMQDKQCDPTKDPLLSPLFMKKESFKKLPPIRISVGEEDCLKDDGIRFLNSLQESGHKDHKLVVYTGLKHGYLNWDIPLGMPITRTCGNDAVQMMTELFNISA